MVSQFEKKRNSRYTFVINLKFKRLVSGKQVKITMTFSKSTEECDGWFDGKDYNGHGSVHVTLIGRDGSLSDSIEMERLYHFFLHSDLQI